MVGHWSCAGGFEKSARRPGDLRWPPRQISLLIAAFLTFVWSLLGVLVWSAT